MKPMMKRHLPLIVLALCLLASGCAGLNKPALEKHYYDITPARPEALAPAVSPSFGALKVRRLSVSPMHSGREMVYRTSENGYSSDFYNGFFVAPADMLSQGLRRWLGESGLFAHVVAPSSLVAGELVLEGNLVALYGDYSGAPEAVATMEFLLLDESRPEVEIVFSSVYSRRVSMSAASPDRLAEGLQRAVAEVYAALEKDLASIKR